SRPGWPWSRLPSIRAGGLSSPTTTATSSGDMSSRSAGRYGRGRRAPSSRGEVPGALPHLVAQHHEGPMRGNHLVVVYTDHEAKRFSITARMERARLPGVNNQMMEMGFEAITLAKGLKKDAANRFKETIRKCYEEAGYAYQAREPLS